MKNILYSIICFVIITSCNSKTELSKAALQGTWTCVDYKMEGGTADNKLREVTREMSMKTQYVFAGDTLIMKNDYFTLGFSCNFKFDEKQIICTPIGFNDVTPRTYAIQEYTGDVLVLVEKNEDIVSTMFLQRPKE